MNFNTAIPVASEISSVDFRFLGSNDVEKLSVKQIVNPQTFDQSSTHLSPNPGGLYDPALGADRDLGHSCATCGLDWRHCPGHLGHISLPTPVYHPLFFDQILRLLRSSCVYCNKLRMSRLKINYYTCQLKLVHHGLLTELAQLETMQMRGKEKVEEGEDVEEDDETENMLPEELMQKREKYVKDAIKKARAAGVSWAMDTSEAVSETRRAIVREILKELTNGKRCNSCTGYATAYRADGYSKLFEKPMSEKTRNTMLAMGMKRKNLFHERKLTKEEQRKAAEAARDPDAMDIDEAVGDVEAVAQTTTTQTEVPEAPAVPYAKQDRILTSLEVYNHLTELFKNEEEFFTLLFRPGVDSKKSKRAPVSADMFFVQTLVVPPTNFRPPAMTGGEIREASMNKLYSKILQTCIQIRDANERLPLLERDDRKNQLRYLVGLFVALQESVNSLFDSSKNPIQGAAGKANEDGIKQKLEKKEGLFRKNMMGKRVNFAARSVISPDPNIETSEIGVPLVFAQKLTYPEPVTDHNFERLRNAVINGPETYPGASQVEMENGQIIDLSKKTVKERTAIAAQLNTASTNVYNGRNKKVHRHLRDGDYVIMNRQPTLHKPSMMGHRARVLPKEKTIRMHYANCNTYNADFDGDEMNMHLPQNDVARAEAQEIACTDWQYLVGTSGKPLRGLIQDHLVMGVWMTNRDTMFTREQYHQLLYSCLRPEEKDNTTGGRILTVYPAIMKPKAMWTGKQVISTILKNITPLELPGLNLTSSAKVKGKSWGEGNEEGEVLFRNGELLCGILDKNQFGPTEFGFVHAVYEVFGPTTAGKLLSVLGRVFTKFLHMRAFTCGMDDLLLTPEGNAARREKLQGSAQVGLEVASKYVGLDEKTFSKGELKRRLEDVLREDKQAGLDLLTNSQTKDFTSAVISTCLPRHLVKPFPKNHMQAMTLSGAKGSDVNSSQISCLLGQQTLEGKRVPVMISGKTLPCFKPFETDVRAGGYIADRFLTGIRPQEYYFHCMAGREGLIDTAVKTSRSGYLQRCLIKGMEGLKVAYDNTVRDSDGSLVQFLYGEDSLDVTKQKYLTDFKFISQNFESLVSRLGINSTSEKANLAAQKVLTDRTAFTYLKETVRHARKYPNTENPPNPVMAEYSPSAFLGSVSEKFHREVEVYMKANPDGYIVKKPKKEGPAPGKFEIQRQHFQDFMYLKYMKSLVDPGEAVGIVAGQSIGEPSTQMTLNTFHLAGHATKNVTLGIPRLREIVMTASASIATPSMTLSLVDERTEEEAEQFRKSINRLLVSELIDKVSVTEKFHQGSNGPVKRFVIRLDFFPKKEYLEEYCCSPRELVDALQSDFLRKLSKAVKDELKKKGKTLKEAIGDDAVPDIGKGKAVNEAAPRESGRDDDDDDDSEDEGDGDTTDSKQKSRMNQSISYEDPDDDEEEIARESSDSSDDEMVDEGITDMSGGENRSGKSLAKQREENIKDLHKNVSKFVFDDKKGEFCEVVLEYPGDTPKILMISIVESVCRSTVIHQIPNIKAVTRMSEQELTKEEAAAGKKKLSTEGVNYPDMWEYCDTYIDANEIYSNDIAAVLRYYGVEAARAVIVSEMQSVFGGHGISVDSRHLSLIGDMMTRSGGYIPFNRTGMTSSISPFMKMSFETTCNFLKEATMYGTRDRLETPSSRIVTGQLSGVGTGNFDLLVDMGDNDAAASE